MNIELNELQIGMIGLGAAAVAGVVFFNRWQEGKQRQLAEKVLERAHNDVLFAEAAESSGEAATKSESPAGARIEPVVAGGEPAADLAFAAVDGRAEPQGGDAPAEVAAEAAAEVIDLPMSQALPAEAATPAAPVKLPPAASAPLSPLVDHIAVVDAAEALSATQILEAQGDWLPRVRKPSRWFGWNEASGQWDRLDPTTLAGQREDPSGKWRRLCLGLQLVDRRGPVSEAEIALFERATHELGERFAGVVELPPSQPALAAAATLDQFCADLDIQIGLNVVNQGQAFAGTKLRALAEGAGMALEVLDGEGRFVRRGDDGQVLFVMSRQERGGFQPESLKTLQVQGVTFILDVPRVAHGDRVFAQMLDLARRFSASLQGVLVDDNRQPLIEGSLEPIRQTIAHTQAAMAARQIPAGGALALRLFA